MIDYKTIFITAISNNTDHTKWQQGDFKSIKVISNSKVGSVGQDFIEEYCKQLGLECNFPMNQKNEKAKQSPWDIEINGVKFELKTSTEDTNGSFQFNHVRYHRKYDALLCLGVTPNELYFGVWTKAQVTTGGAGNLVSMEKGANASYKLTKKPANLIQISEFHDIISKFTSDFTTK